MESHVFRAYDIRGIYGQDIFAEDALKVGRGFATFMGEGPIVVGHDARASSPLLAKASIAGIASCGNQVRFIGLASTPEVFFAAYRLGCPGLGVGASHNPPEYCGFKFAKADGTEYADEKLGELYKVIRDGPYRVGEWDKAGKVEEISIRDEYVDNIVSKVRPDRSLKIVVDVMHGCGGAGAEVLRRLGHEVEVLNLEPKGDFGGKTPEPKEGNLGELQKAVVESKADFGCALDGDGDRCVFLDEEGKILRGDAVLMLMARHALRESGAPTIVATVNCSQKLEEFVNKIGGRVVWSKVGRVYIDQLVVEHGAQVAGEESSHFWFPSFYPFSDGPLAAAKFSEMVAGLDKPLSKAVGELGLGFEAKGKVGVPEERKWAIMEKVVGEMKKGGEFIDVDGIKVVRDDHWAIVRASNTEPILKVNVEAQSREKAELLLRKYVKAVEALV